MSSVLFSPAWSGEWLLKLSQTFRAQRGSQKQDVGGLGCEDRRLVEGAGCCQEKDTAQ